MGNPLDQRIVAIPVTVPVTEELPSNPSASLPDLPASVPANSGTGGDSMAGNPATAPQSVPAADVVVPSELWDQLNSFKFPDWKQILG